MYSVGAIKNAHLASFWYPTWECRFYCDIDTVPAETIKQLSSMSNVRLIEMRSSQEPNWSIPHWGSFWRFFVCEDPSVDRAIFRDTDSRIGKREAVAVHEWLSSGKQFHVMRDHPHHAIEIMAGMWGAVADSMRDIRQLVSSYHDSGGTKSSAYGLEQEFLRSVMWSRVSKSVLVHDPFFAKIPFPLSAIQRDPKHFVGQIYDENDNPSDR